MKLDDFREWLRSGKRPDEIAEERKGEALAREIVDEDDYHFEDEAKIEVSSDIFSNSFVFKCRGREARIGREELIDKRVDQARHFVMVTLIHKLGLTINEATAFLDASTVTVDRDKLGWKLDDEEKGRNPIKGKQATLIVIDDPLDHPNCRCVTTPVEGTKEKAEKWLEENQDLLLNLKKTKREGVFVDGDTIVGVDPAKGGDKGALTVMKRRENGTFEVKAFDVFEGEPE